MSSAAWSNLVSFQRIPSSIGRHTGRLPETRPVGPRKVRQMHESGGYRRLGDPAAAGGEQALGLVEPHAR